MDPKLPVPCFLAFIAYPILRLRALRLTRHGIPVLDLCIKCLAFCIFSRNGVDIRGLHFNDGFSRRRFGWGNGRWSDGSHQIVVGPGGDLAADGALRTGGIAVAGTAIHHALGHSGNPGAGIGGVGVGRLRWDVWCWRLRWTRSYLGCWRWKGLRRVLRKSVVKHPFGGFVENKQRRHKEEHPAQCAGIKTLGRWAERPLTP
ncbi:hypothetical protein BH10PSE16_BH10PSE16_35870 [soil metagenome]